MAKWAIRKPCDLILEPCIGQAALLQECRQRLIDLGRVPNRTGMNLFGTDIDPSAIAEASENGFKGTFIKGDFLDVEAGVPKDGKQIPLVHAAACNPPYTRHHLLSSRYKAHISAAESKKNGITISRRSGLYIYFLIHSLGFLRQGAKLAFIMPSQFLEAQYAKSVRDFIAERYRIVSIITFDRKLNIFSEANVSPCIILMENSEERTKGTLFIELRKWPRVESLLKSVNYTDLLLAKSLGRALEIPQSSLQNTEKWTVFGPSETGKFDRSRYVRLGSLLKVKRGIATGANEFFTLSDPDVKRLRIERRFLEPVLTHTRNAATCKFGRKDFESLRKEGEKVWLLNCKVPKRKLEGTRALNYIRNAERKHYNERVLTGSRRPWYKPESREPAPILFTYMTSGRPRFILNEGRVLNLNNLHCLYLRPHVSKSSSRIATLVHVLNSKEVIAQLPQVGRVYGGGLIKVEPRELENVMLPSGL
jgi:adenine-specific DNA-methyltransferase